MFYAARYIPTKQIVSVGDTPNLPNIPIFLGNAAAGFEGTAEDYEFLILDAATYNELAFKLSQRPIYDNGVISFPTDFVDIQQLAKRQAANFKRGFVVRKKFTTILDRKVMPLWQAI